LKRILDRIKKTVLKLARKYRIEVLGVVLYGSRARGDYSLHSDYDIFVLLGNKTTLLQFVQFSSELKMARPKLGNVKVYAITEEGFKTVLEENPFLGAFCYIITMEGKPIYDPSNSFKHLQAWVKGFSKSEKRMFLRRCIKMSRKLKSPRWVTHWQEAMRNYR